MPMFEYVCADCGNVFTEFRSISDRDNPLPCPKCGGDNVERKVSACASLGGASEGGSSCGSYGGFS
jgi:putative FmdB family regulatory protein